MRLGATGVERDARPGPTASVANADLRARLAAARTPRPTPQFALLATGDVSSPGRRRSLAEPGRAGTVAFNQLGDLSAAPVSVAAGSGSVVLDFAGNVDGTARRARLARPRRARAAGGHLLGHEDEDTGFDVAATGVSAQVAAGAAAVGIIERQRHPDADRHRPGPWEARAAPSRSRALPGLTVVRLARRCRSTDTQGAGSYFRIAGNGTLGARRLPRPQRGGHRSRGTAARSTCRLGTSERERLFADGTFAAAGAVAVALPAAVDGLTLTGSATVALDASHPSDVVSRRGDRDRPHDSPPPGR